MLAAIAVTRGGSVISSSKVQAFLLDQIRAYQTSNPLGRVTLVVDSPRQGWLLRRQLAMSSGQFGLANVHIATQAEFLGEVCSRLNIATPPNQEQIVRSLAAEELLLAETGPLKVASQHPETLQMMLDLADELQWCELSVADLAQIDGVASITSKSAVQFVKRLRDELGGGAALNKWHEQVEQIVGAPDIARLGSTFGLTIVAGDALPDALFQTLTVFESAGLPVARVSLSNETTSSKVLLNKVFSCPSPETEVGIAAQTVIQWIDEGVSPNDIAVAFSTSAPYAKLVAAELDAAGIAWNGPTAQSFASLSLPRIAVLIAEMAAETAQGQPALTRPRLIKWLSSPRIFFKGEYLNAKALQRLIHDENLYGDVTNWTTSLNALADFEPEDPDDSRAARKLANSEHAPVLIGVIGWLNDVVTALATEKSWPNAGAILYDFLKSAHIGSNWYSNVAVERESAEFIEQLLTVAFRKIDIATTLPAQGLAQLLHRQFHSRKITNGTLSIGVHVGSIASTSLLKYERVIALGLGEGFFPATRGNSPLLPDDVREILRKSPGDLPLLEEKIANELRTVRSLVESADVVIGTFPRGGHSAVSSGRLSPSVDGPEEKIESSQQLITQYLPVRTSQIRMRQLLASNEVPAELKAQVAASRAWTQPNYGPLFGQLDGVDRPSLTDGSISSSAIESFIHCPHRFFVEKVLRVKTDTYDHTIDEISASDLGTLVHSIFEDFFNIVEKQSLRKSDGELPDNALAVLRQVFDEHAATAELQGLVGWMPSWTLRKSQLRDALPEFLVVDQMLRRGGVLAHSVSEKAFGGKDAVVTLSDGTAVSLSGYIDRVDLSDDAAVASVVDYKTGKSKSYKDAMIEEKSKKRTKVQDLVYDAAAKRLWPTATDIAVNFFFFPNGGAPTLVESPDFNREALLIEYLEEMQAAMESGLFEFKPAGRYDYCAACNFYGRRANKLSNTTGGEDE